MTSRAVGVTSSAGPDALHVVRYGATYVDAMVSDAAAAATVPLIPN